MINKEEYYVCERPMEGCVELLQELFPEPKYSIGLKELSDVDVMPQVKSVKMIAVMGNPHVPESTFDRRGFIVELQGGMTVLMFNTKTPYFGMLVTLAVTVFFLVINWGALSWMLALMSGLLLMFFVPEIAKFLNEVKRCEKAFDNTHKLLDEMGVDMIKAFSGLKVQLSQQRISPPPT